jgi:hypothetical protein
MANKKIEDQNGEKNVLPVVNQCFIITPIGEVNSDVYVKAMGLIEAVIEPVLEEFNFKAVAANHISSPGSISKQLIKSILEDKLVIANLTGLNPNVMYELAVRHAARLPVVIMAETGTRLPFDITDQRTIFYDDSLAGLNVAREQLRSMVEKAIDDKEPDNPIYQAAEQALIFKELKANDPLKVVMDRLDSMEGLLRSSTNLGRLDLRSAQYPVKEPTISVSGRFLKPGPENEEFFDSVVASIEKSSGLQLLRGAHNDHTFNLTVSADRIADLNNFQRLMHKSERIKLDPFEIS